MNPLETYATRIIARREIPPRPARFGDLPQGLDPRLQEALRARGIERLYSHQAEFARRALEGENLVITTGTASGKTLAYLLPVLQALLEDPACRALFLYPTKALSQDQLRGMLEVLAELPGGETLEAGVYDGDTPPLERRRLRDRGRLILTNPDMLNAAWLPNHGRRGFSQVFRNLRYLVVDEMHTYRGAFGSHVANLMRRLSRVTAHYGSSPQILCSSATIANPIELAEALFDRPFGHVEEDGSPSAGRVIHFWQPPVVDGDFRRGVVQEMSDVLPELVAARRRTIAFCRSRKDTEVVLKETRDALRSVDGGHDESRLVAAYRGGYTPEERRGVQSDLLAGKLMAVVSTNALELGVDIGQLEVVLQAGFPGTRASFWQQIGRAGRRGRTAEAYLMLRMSPMDQFIAMDPDWLLGRKSERAVIDPKNLMIQLAHVRAAAAELPLSLDDLELFPDLGEIVGILTEAGEVRDVFGSFHWAGDAHPAGDFSLRNMDRDRFKIVNVESGETLTEMDRPQTYHEAHWRAVYLHDGMQYMVDELDLVGHVAKVRPVDQNYYTEPDVRTSIEVLNVQKTRDAFRGRLRFGDVRVDDVTVGYKMLQFHNHQNLGYEMLPERLETRLETEGVWLTVPEEVMQLLGSREDDHLRGLIHPLLARARLLSMAEGADLRGTSFHYTEEETGATRTCLLLHDGHPGGLGFSQKVEEFMEEVLHGALRLLERCRCRDGCPACVGDWRLEKDLLLWAFRSLFEEIEPPRHLLPAGGGAEQAPVLNSGAPRTSPPLVETNKPFTLQDTPRRWRDILRALPPRARGVAFLRQVDAVRLRGADLVLQVESEGVKAWVENEKTARALAQLIAQVVKAPANFRVRAETLSRAKDEAERTRAKLKRRHDDLTGETHADGAS